MTFKAPLYALAAVFLLGLAACDQRNGLAQSTLPTSPPTPVTSGSGPVTSGLGGAPVTAGSQGTYGAPSTRP